ncbi:MAG: hypothetical protein F6K54_14765 [Okeania sp. SIO3B5]|nr:hypothetical protein [Okeania sp. SIO3B5]NEO54232.1 hypothetical protein [Okeania sp. SIO3B5]
MVIEVKSQKSKVKSQKLEVNRKEEGRRKKKSKVISYKLEVRSYLTFDF